MAWSCLSAEDVHIAVQMYGRRRPIKRQAAKGGPECGNKCFCLDNAGQCYVNAC